MPKALASSDPRPAAGSSASKERVLTASPGPGASEVSAVPARAMHGAPRAGGPRRVAVVGAGFIADFHLAILKAIGGVEVVAVCDPDLARARSLASRYSIEHTVARIEELAGLRIDVAHVLIPPHLHVEVSQKLIDLSIGVFVEKPLALTSTDARALAELAEARGVPLGANHNNLFHPAFRRMLERIAAGDIGRVEHVRATLSVPLMQLEAGDYAHWMFRAPRNIVFEQAVHPLCLVHALIGGVETAHTTILGTRELHPGQVFHDRWAVAARGEHGTAEIYLAFGQGFTRYTIEVLGSDGSLEADLHHDHLAGERKTVWLDFFNSFLAGRRRARAYSRDAWRVLANYLRFTLGLSRREDAFFAGMRGSIESFYAALAARSAPPTSGGQAAEVLEWCEAVARGIPGESAAPAAPTAIAAPRAARANEVVVLGATGFIGRRVVSKLLAAGLPVTVVARRRHALPPEIARGASDGSVRFFAASLDATSLDDGAALASALDGAATIVHLATGSGDTWDKIERSMVHGTRALAELALEKRVKRFIYVSSIAALDTGQRGKVFDDGFDLDPRPEARSLYARGKIAAERTLLELAHERRLPLTVVRPGVVVGDGTPMQHSGLGLWVRDNHCVGFGAGDHALPLVWVDDVADALVSLVRHEKDDLAGRALNLCARAPMSAADMVSELRRATGRDLHFHPRSLVLSQTLEIGKWIVKKVGGRKDAEFPSWHDLKARALFSSFSSRTARDVLGWKPLEDRDTLLARVVQIYARR